MASVAIMSLLAVAAMVFLFHSGPRNAARSGDGGLRMQAVDLGFPSLERIKAAASGRIRTWRADPEGAPPCARGCE
jgi:hypothetical protein